jgi:hypothetical protein
VQALGWYNGIAVWKSYMFSVHIVSLLLYIPVSMIRPPKPRAKTA